jgi:hypothetical protein
LQRNKALNAFKAEDSKIRVILLSLENAASGTNLIEASHIILMGNSPTSSLVSLLSLSSPLFTHLFAPLDPVTETKKEAQPVESQAIGRALRQGQTCQVTIVR